jgi:hypothetical protein
MKSSSVILLHKNELRVLQLILNNFNFNCNTPSLNDLREIEQKAMQLNLIALKNKLLNRNNLKEKIKIKFSLLEILVLFYFLTTLEINETDSYLLVHINTIIEKLYFNLCK